MHRIAIPYGNLRSDQLRMLARIAREHDRGYGHFSTRPNIQFNWIELEDTPEILAKLASVQMHAIQTSGNCIRNITTEPVRGRRARRSDRPAPLGGDPAPVVDVPPRIRLFLPRKFKIAVSGAKEDRAAVQMHDLGLYLSRNPTQGEVVASDPGRRRPGPHADRRPGDPRRPALAAPADLLRGHPARLQPLRPPRQPVQGADQDPREGAVAGEVRAAGGGRVAAPEGRPVDAHAGRARPRVAVLRRRPSTRSWPTPTRRSSSTCSRTRPSRAGSSATWRRTRCRATPP